MVASLAVASTIAVDDHDTGRGHPERADRLVAALAGVHDADLGNVARPDEPRLGAPSRGVKGLRYLVFRGRGVRRGRRRSSRSRHRRLTGIVEHRDTGRGVRAGSARRPPRRRSRRRVRDRATTRSPRDESARPGVLPDQQHRGRRRRRWWPTANGCSSSTGTFTTGTAPRTSSGTTRACCTCRRTSRRPTRAPAASWRPAAPNAVGLTINFPLPPGATGDIARDALDEVVAPAVERFSPTWVLVSAGFDAHRADPLADLEWSAATTSV